jgi:hypothetical protein
MRLMLIALAVIALAGCKNDSDSPNAEQDSAQATGTTGTDRNKSQGTGSSGSNDTGWDGKTEDGAKPPDGR